MKFALGFALYCMLGSWLLVTISLWFQPEYAENNLTAWIFTVGIWSFLGAWVGKND